MALRSGSHQLFLSFIRPFNPVVKGSIAQWLRSLIQEAGVTGGYLLLLPGFRGKLHN